MGTTGGETPETPHATALPSKASGCATCLRLSAFSGTKHARRWNQVHNQSHKGKNKITRIQEPTQNVFLSGDMSCIPIACGRGGEEICQQIDNVLTCWETLFFQLPVKDDKILFSLALFISSHHTLFSNICKNFEAILLQIHI